MQVNYRIKVIDGRAVFQAYCPDCGKPYTLQKDKRSARTTSIGAHMIDAHDRSHCDMVEFVVTCREIAKRKKTERRIEQDQLMEETRIASENAKRELEERQKIRNSSTITLTASDVDEIQGELQSLIGMMEPYYAQGNCYRDAQELIDKLEDMLCATHNPTDGG